MILGGGSAHKLSSKLRPDEDMVETWQAQQARKRKIIVLSDSSSSNSGSEDEVEEGGGKHRKRSRATQEGNFSVCSIFLFFFLWHFRDDVN